MSASKASLTVSIVVYGLDPDLLKKTLQSLFASIRRAQQAGLIGGSTVDLIDNGLNGTLSELARDERRRLSDSAIKLTLRSGHGNVGYGRGHNLSILGSQSNFHLVLNPDVVLEETAIGEAVSHLMAHPATALVTPEVRGPGGERQYLCKDYPSLIVLYLRSFAPRWLRARSADKMAAYEMRHVIDRGEVASVPVATGCFMVARTADLKRIEGFSPAFFLYFEDYDLSLRIREIGDVVYVPSVRIVHYGGDASSKGLKHIRMFARSAFTFFRRHGWRFW